MKKLIIALAFAALTLTACGKKDAEPTVTQIGSGANGYLTVEGAWAQVGGENGKKASYSRKEDNGYTYITFDTIDMSGTDTALYTLIYTAQAYRDFYIDEGLSRLGINGGLQMGKYETSVVTGNFTDGASDGYCATYLFYDEAHNLHLVTVEGEKEKVKEIEKFTDTYTFDISNAGGGDTQSGDSSYDGDFSPYD